MDWISNRELAIITGILIVAILLFWIPAMRGPMLNLLRIGVNPHLIFLTLGISISTAFALIIFEPKLGWSNRQLWLAFIWLFTVGLPISFKVVNRFREAKWAVVREELMKALSITFVIDFIVNFSSFSFLVELLLILVLLVVTLAILGGIKNADQETQEQLILASEIISIALGFAYLTWSIIFISHNPTSIFEIESVINLVLPLLLTSFFSFYLCALFLYVSYQDAFTRMTLYNQDELLRRYSQRAAVTSFGANVGMLKHWLDVIAVTRPTTPLEVETSLSRAYLKVPISKLYE